MVIYFYFLNCITLHSFYEDIEYKSVQFEGRQVLAFSTETVESLASKRLLVVFFRFDSTTMMGVSMSRRKVSSSRRLNSDKKAFLLQEAKAFNGSVLEPQNLRKLAELLVAQERFNLGEVEPMAVKGVLSLIHRHNVDKPGIRKRHRRRMMIFVQ